WARRLLRAGARPARLGLSLRHGDGAPRRDRPCTRPSAGAGGRDPRRERAAPASGETGVSTEAERALEMLLPEREADRAPELDELGLGELRVQLLPEGVVGEIGVPHDRVRPAQ